MRQALWILFWTIVVEFLIAPIGGRVFDHFVPQDAGIRNMIPEIPFYEWGYATVFALGVVIGIAVYRWRTKKHTNAPANSAELGPIAENIFNQEFKMRTVPLDGKRFISCTFEDVTFNYEGKAHFEFVSCKHKGQSGYYSNNDSLNVQLHLLKTMGVLEKTFSNNIKIVPKPSVATPSHIPATTKAPPAPPRPQLLFGAPRQEAGEPYLAWWHIPIGLEVTGDSPFATWANCTVELFGDAGNAPPINLRWQADNEPKGSQETTLVEGVERLVPIALRAEPPHGDGKARITGTAYLRDGNTDKFVLQPGITKFRMRVKRGPKSWESKHVYRLRVPHHGDGNSGFVLEIEKLFP